MIRLKIISLIVSTFILTVTLNKSFGQQEKKNIEVKITFVEKDSIKSNKVHIRVEVVNKSKKPIVIVVPEDLNYGLNSDPLADFIVKIEKKGRDSLFRPFEIPVNYFPQVSDEKFSQIKNNESFKSGLDVATFFGYRIPVGNYRIRLLYKISKHNKIKDVYSNWLELSIKKLLPLL